MIHIFSRITSLFFSFFFLYNTFLSVLCFEKHDQSGLISIKVVSTPILI